MTTLRLSAQIDEAEIKMRRALRLETSSTGGRSEANAESRPSRRFTQSGDVSVTRVSSRKDHLSATTSSALAAAEEALQTARLGREQAEASLAQANATIVALQTKLAHADIARAEAVAHAEAMATELRNREERHKAPIAPEPTDLIAGDRSVIVAEQAAVALISGDHEADGCEEPVQWWVPGWQGSFRR